MRQAFSQQLFGFQFLTSHAHPIDFRYFSMLFRDKAYIRAFPETTEAGMKLIAKVMLMN